MPSPRDNPGVIAPPPLLFAGFLAVGLAVDALLLPVRTALPAPLRHGAAALLAIAGLALLAGAWHRFHRAGTSPEPWRPTTAIVTSGVYGWTRNPMYLAMTLGYVAVALWADSLVAFALLAPLLVVMRYGVIAREERYLTAKFGDEYSRYAASVRRWL